MYVYINTYIHTYIHTHTYLLTYIHTYTHTCIPESAYAHMIYAHAHAHARYTVAAACETTVHTSTSKTKPCMKKQRNPLSRTHFLFKNVIPCQCQANLIQYIQSKHSNAE